MKRAAEDDNRLETGSLPMRDFLVPSLSPVPFPSQPGSMDVAIVKSIPQSALRGSFLEYMKSQTDKRGRLQDWIANAIFAFLEKRFKSLTWTMRRRATFAECSLHQTNLQGHQQWCAELAFAAG